MTGPFQADDQTIRVFEKDICRRRTNSRHISVIEQSNLLVPGPIDKEFLAGSQHPQTSAVTSPPAVDKPIEAK